MRKATARGRVFPQSFSTDRRYGRLSLKACALFPLIWANADDQGRLCGDPEEIKYSCCPNIDHITKIDIPDILLDLHTNSLILLYATPKSPAIQILDWWDTQKLQWAWPSDYPPSEDWFDRLRYKKSATEAVSDNWEGKGGYEQKNPQVRMNLFSGENGNGSQVRAKTASGENFPALIDERDFSLPTTSPEDKVEIISGIRSGSGSGNSPESTFGSQVRAKIASPEDLSPSFNPSTSPAADSSLLLEELTFCYRMRWGRIKASEPEKIIPREPGGKMTAQLRDLSTELANHNCPIKYVREAFDECSGASQQKISYARAVLLDWLGVPR